MFILILLTIIYCYQSSTSNRVNYVETTLNTTLQESQTYTILVNEEFHLYEDEGDKIVQNLLFRRDELYHKIGIHVEQDYDELEQEERKLEGSAGCESIQRSFITNTKYRMRLPSNGTIYYSDMLVLQNRALIIRNDFMLNQINLSDDGLTKSHEVRQLGISKNIEHPFFVHNPKQGQVYVISSSGGVSFSDSQPVSSMTIKEQHFVKRDVVYKAYLRNYLYIACGGDGIDVYSTRDGNIKLMQNVAEINNKKIYAMDISGDDQYIYVLDYEYGLLICDYDFNFIYSVYIPAGSDFDHYGNTFFVIAESINKEDYAAEFFLNHTNKTYYLNRNFVDEMQFYDVKVYERYALLIGYDVHKIVTHSISRDFIYPYLEPNSYFEQPLLMQVQKWDHYMMTMGKYDFRQIEIIEKQPHILCMSPIEVQQTYLAYLYEVQNPPYNLNLSVRKFKIIVKDNSLLKRQNIILGCIVISILICVVWITVIITLCFVNYKKKLEKQEEDKQKLTDKAKQDAENEGQGLELSQL